MNESWRMCSCGNERGAHRDGGGACAGMDSYGVACACPSFELSQEEREADVPIPRDAEAESEQESTLHRYARLLQEYGRPTVIDFYPLAGVDRWGVVTIGEWGGYLVQIMPKIFNDRLILAPVGKFGHDHGWCYDKGSAAFLAALVWDPVHEAEPLGYKKRATAHLRKAGEVASGWSRAHDAP
jgi:hypothetical protein